MFMGYEQYRRHFNNFRNSEGYYAATRLLLIDSEWMQFSQYKERIRQAMESCRTRLGATTLRAADFCCGDYAWIARHFSSMCNRIYCIDLEENALESSAILGNKSCTALKRDASKRLFRAGSIDFLFCGFTLHDSFIEKFGSYLKENGSMFLMKPIDGDDFYLRERFDGYDLAARRREVGRITKDLVKLGLSVKHEVRRYDWFFTESTDKVLAALSVVCMGEPHLLSKGDYVSAFRFLNSKSDGGRVRLSQRWSMWEVTKHGDTLQ